MSLPRWRCGFRTAGRSTSVKSWRKSLQRLSRRGRAVSTSAAGELQHSRGPAVRTWTSSVKTRLQITHVCANTLMLSTKASHKLLTMEEKKTTLSREWTAKMTDPLLDWRENRTGKRKNSCWLKFKSQTLVPNKSNKLKNCWEERFLCCCRSNRELRLTRTL